MPSLARCPGCGTEFRDASGSPGLTCPNCRLEFPRPLARSRERIRLPRYPFAYQDLATPAVADFRRRYRLDRVIAGARDEFEALTAIRDWTFRRFPRGTPVHQQLDAEAILAAGRKGGTFHCTYYAFVSVQACTALGHVARRLNIDRPQPAPGRFAHMVYDVWSNQLDQWVVMDSKANIHFELDDKPLSALELRRAWHEGRGGRIRAVFGHGREKRLLPKDRSELSAWGNAYYSKLWKRKETVWGPQLIEMTDPANYGFIGVYGAADFFSRPAAPNFVKHFPVLLWYDRWNGGERWLCDKKNPASPEAYRLEGLLKPVRRRQDLEWPVNRTEIQLLPATPAGWPVTLVTCTPNFSRFEFRLDGGSWRQARLSNGPANLKEIPVLHLPAEAGRVLEVSSVNLGGVRGSADRVRLPVARD
ncbi:MAG TPA: transglutaminase domain-containing protein [bacterium]|uniref:Transglutaminase-like domain-containing protein n=1 Tax=candidate division TA06 bacterium ADurb.Bin417 TaxID=1852828 RepID=A0A1V5MEF4_UNCT6|nr:MAG: hypothetical protein BWY73_01071 [candidate division TA06 bacterium ADurb.Bin417]HNQ35437.1 transglutaminase domain-containing protein [bacterium]HNS49034.1 transglutaminase domain-containing protein [bacterium]